jgi:hypothetical protein
MHGNMNVKLREIFGMKTEGVAEGWTKLHIDKAAWFELVTECWWVVNWNTVGQMGQEYRAGENKNTHKI